jgi:hypothetical protein
LFVVVFVITFMFVFVRCWKFHLCVGSTNPSCVTSIDVFVTNNDTCMTVTTQGFPQLVSHFPLERGLRIDLSHVAYRGTRESVHFGNELSIMCEHKVG